MQFPACYQVYGRDFFIEPASAQFANAVFQDEYQINALRSHTVRFILDIGAHVGSFTVMCHQCWPDAKIVAVEPHPDSFDLLERNTQHIPKDKLTLINAAISKESGKCMLASPVSHSRVSEYVPTIWNSMEPRPSDFGLQVDSITPKDLWQLLGDVGIDEVDLLKLDCEGAEYLIVSELSALGLMDRIGWIRGEWHSRKDNQLLANFLGQTHVFHIDPNYPHTVGMFVAHRI
ncbi:MAG: FkbM family methyltransferase [Planctomycetes bacterium]|nr:FkbM family methyltransferase [Planctomycetota bacterium]